MKKVLVVMSTLGMGGAEKSLISFLNMVEKDFLDDNKISIDFLTADSGMQIVSPNGHLCHIRRTARDIISGQTGTH